MSFAEETYAGETYGGEPAAARVGIDGRLTRLRTRAAAVGRWAAAITPGFALAAGIAALATLIGGFAPVVGAPVIAIVSGIAVAAVRRPSAAMVPGMTFTAKKVLQGSIIVLGTGLSLSEVAAAGTGSLPVTVGTLAIALTVAAVVGRRLGLDRDLRTLIGVGTAICGASAIAATDAVIDARKADVSYAIATIFTFNVVAVLLYPTLGHVLGLSQHSFGTWAGTAINDVSSVVAAGTIYGHSAASYAVVVKLTRTLAIIPITLWLASRYRPGSAATSGSAATTASTASSVDVGPDTGGRFSLRRVVPVFILAFLAAVAANSAGLIPAGWHHGLSSVSAFMITAALASIGLSTDFGHIRRAGLRPIGLGAILWATVGLTSLALQAATGTL